MYCKYSNQRVEEVPMERLLIKLKNPFNQKHITALKQIFKNVLKNENEVWDINDHTESLADVQVILDIIFNIVIPITMFLCFFSLSSSMSANLYE